MKDWVVVAPGGSVVCRKCVRATDQIVEFVRADGRTCGRCGRKG